MGESMIICKFDSKKDQNLYKVNEALWRMLLYLWRKFFLDIYSPIRGVLKSDTD